MANTITKPKLGEQDCLHGKAHYLNAISQNLVIADKNQDVSGLTLGKNRLKAIQT